MLSPSRNYWIPETSALRQEIGGLEALETQMSQSLSAMRARCDKEKFSRSLRGRALHSVTFIFGIYCTYRVVVVREHLWLVSCMGLKTCNLLKSGINLILPWSRSTPSADGTAPTDLAIRWMLSTFPSLESSLAITPGRAVSFSRQFYLLMIGIIVLSSVRRVLRGVNKVFLSSTAGARVPVQSTYYLGEFDELAD